MLRGLVLWLMGVPLILVILIWMFFLNRPGKCRACSVQIGWPTSMRLPSGSAKTKARRP